MKFIKFITKPFVVLTIILVIALGGGIGYAVYETLSEDNTEENVTVVEGSDNASSATASLRYSASGDKSTKSTTATTVTAANGIEYTLSDDGTYYTVSGYSGSATSVTIPSAYNDIAVTAIGASAFIVNTTITSVTIPDSVTEIGNNAFYYCPMMTCIYYGGTASQWASINFESVSSNPLYNSGVNLYLNGTLATDITIEGISTINLSAFHSCYSLTSVSIGDSVTSIGDYTFDFCTSLTSVTIGSGVTSIGLYAFYACDSLTSVNIPDSVTSIGDYAFEGCSLITSITIGKNVIEIGKCAFYLSYYEINVNVIFKNTDGWYYTDTKGATSGTNLSASDLANSSTAAGYLTYHSGYGIYNYYLYRTSGQNLEYELSSDETYYTVVGIGSYVGTELEIPSTYNDLPVTAIGGEAFRECALTSVTIPDSVTTIGSNAFMYCTSLTSVTLGSGLESICYGAFEGCSNLTSITIPASVTTIGAKAFYQCDNLATATFKNTSGWYVTTTEGASSGTNLSSTDLADTSTAATYLKDTYCNYHFYYGDILEYELSANGTYYTVVGIGTYSSTDVVIPSTYNGLPVTAIGDKAFYGNTNITSITISISLTSIGSYAFDGCTSLTTVYYSGTASQWASYISFAYNVYSNPLFYADSLYLNGNLATDITLEGISQINPYAFQGYTSLESVTIGSGVTKICYMAFTGCSNLSSLTISDEVTSISNHVFYKCSNLTSVTFENTDGWYVTTTSGATSGTIVDLSSTSMAAYYLRSTYCEYYWYYKTPNTDVDSLEYELSGDGTYYTIVGIGSYTSTSLTVPSTYNGLPVTAIGDSAFKESSLLKVVINSNITSIGSYAFYSSSLSSITLPNSITSISDYTFYNTNLSSITIPDSVTTIGNYTFANCKSLQTVTMGSGVTSIGSYAFYGCTALISITIPDGVTEIGSSVFHNCTSLTNITIPNSVTTIGNYAFYGCKILQTVTMGSGVISIGSYAFSGCQALTSITIPTDVTSIGTYAFYNCVRLTEINFNATQMTGLSSKNYVFYCAGQSGTGITVNIGKNVKNIPAYLFNAYNSADYAPNIVSVVFEDGCVCDTIYNYAFGYCSTLASIDIPDCVTTIGNYAFKGCTGLTSIIISDGVTSIGTGAFYDCTTLESVTVGRNVETISNYAFYNCTALTEINFNATAMEDLSTDNYIFYCAGYAGSGLSSNIAITLNVGANVTKIPAYLFYSYSRYDSFISSVVFEDNGVCESIGDYAFYYCSLMTSITIPDSVTSIGSYAFYRCALESVTIGSGVTSIDKYAFFYCSKLVSVTFVNYEGWYISTDEDGTDIIRNLNADSLEDPSTAATYLMNTYRAYYWRNGDKTAPTGAFYDENGDKITSEYFNGYIKFVATDNTGVAILYIKTPDGDWEASYSSSYEILTTLSEGTYYFFATDEAGNTSVTYSITIDRTAPTITLYAGDTEISNGGHTNASYIYASVLDSGSGISAIYYSNGGDDELYTNETQLTSDGTYSFYAIDLAGNTSEVYTVCLDTTIPTGQIYVDSDPVDNGYTMTSDELANKLAQNADYRLQVSFTASDDGSGIDYVMIKLPDAEEYVLMTDNAYNGLCGEYSFYAVDLAGNVSTVYTLTVEHSYYETYVEANCTEQGYTLHTCSVCGAWYIDNIQNAFGHVYGEGVEVEASCTTAGGTYYTCIVCGYEHIENYVEPTGHNYVADPDLFVAATCTSEGHRTYVCSSCGATYITTIVKTAHSYTVVATLDNEDGTVTKIYACEHEVDTAELTTLISSFSSNAEVLAYFEDNEIAGVLIETTGKTYSGVAGFIISLYDRYSPYMVWVLLGTALAWSVFIGISLVLANRNDERERSKRMIINYVIGLVVIFVLLMAVPYLANFFAILLAG